jgi:hypothetical protein
MALVGGGLLAAWLASAASYRVTPAPSPAAPPAPAPTSPSEIEAEAARLRQLLSPRSELRPGGRNPFRFAPRADRATIPRVTPTVDAPPVSAVPPSAPVRLVGIAESSSGAGMERTAILTLEGRLVLAKEGEAVEARYRVERVAAEAAELTDLATDSRITLALDR